MNDGLVSNASLIMGVAGAAPIRDVIVLTRRRGPARRRVLDGGGRVRLGALAARDVRVPDRPRARRARRVPGGGSRRARADLRRRAAWTSSEAARISRDADRRTRDAALDTLAREELGLNPEDLGSPWGAAIFSFLSFAAGASYRSRRSCCGRAQPRGDSIAAVLTAVALFGVGAALSLFTGRNALRGGLRMLLIGGGAGVVTLLIGSLLGAAVGYPPRSALQQSVEGLAKRARAAAASPSRSRISATPRDSRRGR